MFIKTTSFFSLARRSLGSGLIIFGAVAAGGAFAASSAGCEGGGFTVLGLSGPQDSSISTGNLGESFRVQGKYVQFDVVASTLGIANYAFLPTDNALDMTLGSITPVYASKAPDHRGLTLASDLLVELKDDALAIQRTGIGLSMKVQAKDCAQGGLFQMEPERTDGTRTEIVHTLATPAGNLTPFYFDNQNFRAREGDEVPYKDIKILVPSRINIANDFSPKFVVRDSPQVATRILESRCTNFITTRNGTRAEVQHCGGVSRWLVASGGRMGMVSGEDATEVAPPSSNCVQNCQAQNRVRGRAVNLGFPFHVAPADRLQPRVP